MELARGGAAADDDADTMMAFTTREGPGPVRRMQMYPPAAVSGGRHARLGK